MAVSQYPVPKIIDGDNWLRNPPHPKDKPTLFQCTYVYACQLFRETKKPQLSFFLLYLLFIFAREKKHNRRTHSVNRNTTFVFSIFLNQSVTSVKMSCINLKLNLVFDIM